MADTKMVDVYLSADRERMYQKGETLGLTGEALRVFSFTGYEEKITYAVNMETGESTPVTLNDMELEGTRDATSNETLTIEPNPQGARIVRVGDRYAELSTDECLWAVVEFLMGRQCQWLRTKEQHETFELCWRESSIKTEEKGTL